MDDPQPDVVDSETFRQVLGCVPTPVTVITTAVEDRAHGTTVSAFSSLSLDPPLVVISLDRGSELLSLVERSGRLGVNVLHEDQDTHAGRFARKGTEKFAEVSWDYHRGLPRLDGCTAWLACSVRDLVPGGDHVLVTALVEHAERTRSSPLIYCERAFARLGSR